MDRLNILDRRDPAWSENMTTLMRYLETTDCEVKWYAAAALFTEGFGEACVVAVMASFIRSRLVVFPAALKWLRAKQIDGLRTPSQTT